MCLSIRSDDTVEVGADLCEIDTDGVATVEASSDAAPVAVEAAAAPAPSPAPAPVAAAPAPAATSASGTRTPSIKFLGKDGWAQLLAGQPPQAPIPVNYGRLAFSDAEMEALVMGGANLAPEVKDYSKGAIFAP